MESINPVFNRSKQVEVQEIHFQALTWYSSDLEIDEDSEGNSRYEFNIFISGVTLNGNTVTLRVVDFNPYFYVEVPDSWTSGQAELFFKGIKNKLWKEGYGLIGYELVSKKKLYPYLALKEFKFVKLIFSSDKTFGRCKWMFSNKSQEEKSIKISGLDTIHYEAYETNVNHINRFCHIHEIETTGWITIKKFTEELEYSSSQINITAKAKDVNPDPNTKSIAPFTVFSYDIETLPENTEEFPDPANKNDVIKQISVVLSKYGSKDIQKFIFTSGPCSPIEDAVIIPGKTEKHLLENYVQFVKITDPDIMTGYNTWGFDDKYIWTRINGVQDPAIISKNPKVFRGYDIDVSCFSRISHENAKLERKELSSSAYGNNEFLYIRCPGRETFDLLVAIRREHKLESFSLNSVAKEFLNEHKVDLPIRALFEKLTGGPDDIAECAIYCIQDSNLVIRLLLKLNMLPNYIEMAKTTYVPMEWLLFRGQQCKVFSLIGLKTSKMDYVIPVNDKRGDQKKFEGATVLKPKTGIYYDPIAGLDFASLYPSIMRAYNMCYSTIVTTPEMMKYVKDNNIPHHTIAWEGSEMEDELSSGKVKYSFTFVQIEDESGKEMPNGVRGVLPIILGELAQGRKATKKLMSGEKDPFMYAVLNGKQLAQKVTMNSIYGFTGAGNGILPLKPIAASVTAVGRDTIEKTSKYAGEKFGAITVYGDSIPPSEKVTIKNYGDITIEEFGDFIDLKWEEYRGFKVGDITVNDKECKDVSFLRYETLTHEGFQHVKKIIRHKTNKKLFKVKAMDALGIIHEVTVTEGHSLIMQDFTTKDCSELKVGDMLYNYAGRKVDISIDKT